MNTPTSKQMEFYGATCLAGAVLACGCLLIGIGALVPPAQSWLPLVGVIGLFGSAAVLSLLPEKKEQVEP